MPHLEQRRSVQQVQTALVRSGSVGVRRVDWQTMESAPREKRVLVWALCYGSYGYTEDQHVMMFARFAAGRWNPDQATGQYWSGFKPLAWVPVPALPQEYLDARWRDSA